MLGAAVAFAAAAAGGVARAETLIPLDRPGLELVMQLVVTCTDPETVGGASHSKDGERTEIWPIVGGRFEGPGIRGEVIPGGGDFPVVRPDGVEVIDALYRLRTDDGVQIIIHNFGLRYPAANGLAERYRLAPEFIAPVGKYDWLNRSLFLSTLVDVPPALALAGPGQNDRMIEIYRVT
ncbi:hypothetical protein ABAC460_15065 [Asticcacaulis sp. AC460]|uniref:DUF3237 family protein n=1 Tax=Asticcacaulis sp. AC460 TaxID=1282360 RepID=UPI0003C4075E|nr:DUF3237 family protein [Asticcacaulis sp. AC460]ESQ88610.1 hypothetical protein ABAC460_15065 [Asticcacaulis sp. AC460]